MNSNRSGRFIVSCIVALASLVVGFGAGYWLGVRGEHGPKPRVGPVGLVAVEAILNFTSVDVAASTTAPDSLPDSRDFEIELRTQAKLLTSEALFKTVLADPNSPIVGSDWAKKFAVGSDGKAIDIPSAARWLGDHLVARPVVDSKLIEVFVDLPEKDARILIEAIVDEHLKEQTRINEQRVLDRSTVLNTLRYKLENELRELSDQRNNMISQLGLRTLPTKEPDDELRELRSKRIELSVASAGAAATVDALSARANDPTTRQASADETAVAHARLDTAKLQVVQLSAAIEAIDRQVETVTTRLQNREMAAADYLNITTRIQDINKKLEDAKTKLDEASIFAARRVVGWAKHPEDSNAR